MYEPWYCTYDPSKHGILVSFKYDKVYMLQTKYLFNFDTNKNDQVCSINTIVILNNMMPEFHTCMQER